MAKERLHMAKKDKPQAAPEVAIEIPADEREFTSREKGGHVIYLQRLQTETVQQGQKFISKPTKRAITARIQFGIKFDPFVECGEYGKNRLFRDIEPETALAALQEAAARRESPIVFWKDRPMDDQEKEHDKALRLANKRIGEQEDENARLRALLEENGLKIPADL
jgi:hypothetical protein